MKRFLIATWIRDSLATILNRFLWVISTTIIIRQWEYFFALIALKKIDDTPDSKKCRFENFRRQYNFSRSEAFAIFMVFSHSGKPLFGLIRHTGNLKDFLIRERIDQQNHVRIIKTQLLR